MPTDWYMGDNPKARNTRWIVILCIVSAAFVFITAHKSCQSPQPQTRIVEQIKYLRDTIYKYEPAKYQPAIIQIRDRYRVLLDTVERFNFDSTWSYVCRMLPDSQTGERCQREVVRRLISGQRDSELIGIYQMQRTEDSLQIGMMFKLDSLTSEQLKQKDGKITQLKKDNRKKVVKFALGGFLSGALIGVFLK
jgi:hypothetical protein